MKRLFKLMLVSATLVAASSVYGEPGGGPGRNDRERGGIAGLQLRGFWNIIPGRWGDRGRFGGGFGGGFGGDRGGDRDRDRRPDFDKMIITDVDFQERAGIATFTALFETKSRGFGRPGNDNNSLDCKGSGSWNFNNRVILISGLCPSQDRNIVVNYALKLDFRRDWRDNDEREVVMNGDEQKFTIDVSRDDVEMGRGFPARDVLLKRVGRMGDNWNRERPWEGHPGWKNDERPGNGGDRPGPGGDRPGNGGDRPGNGGDRPGPGGDRPGSGGGRPGGGNGPGPRPK